MASVNPMKQGVDRLWAIVKVAAELVDPTILVRAIRDDAINFVVAHLLSLQRQRIRMLASAMVVTSTNRSSRSIQIEHDFKGITLTMEQ